jgi:hypothetical protein
MLAFLCACFWFIAGLIAMFPIMAMSMIVYVAGPASVAAGIGAGIYCLLMLDPKRHNKPLEWLAPLTLGTIALALSGVAWGIIELDDWHAPVKSGRALFYDAVVLIPMILSWRRQRRSIKPLA